MEELLSKATELKDILIEIDNLRQKLLDNLNNPDRLRTLQSAIDFKTNSCLQFVTYKESGKNGKKYLTLIDTRDGSSICFRVEAIELEKSKLGERFHPEQMFK